MGDLTVFRYLPYNLHIQLRVKVEILGNQSNLFTFGSAYVMVISQLDKCYNHLESSSKVIIPLLAWIFFLKLNIYMSGLWIFKINLLLMFKKESFLKIEIWR